MTHNQKKQPIIEIEFLKGMDDGTSRKEYQYSYYNNVQKLKENMNIMKGKMDDIEKLQNGPLIDACNTIIP